MAKSKVGGSRAYIRGRIGADVYSIGKDGKGSRQQVVRSLAEQVSNPRTESQMRGRMIMSTVMQAVSYLSPIIDHSFDGVPKGQPSISEFISRNYALVKNDVQLHPDDNNAFDLVPYGRKGLVNGRFQISNGKAQLPNAIKADDEDNLYLTLDQVNPTVADFKAAWELTKDEYLTTAQPAINIQGAYEGVKFARLSFDFAVADTTPLTTEVLSAALKVEGNMNVTVSYADSAVKFSGPAVESKSQIIVSRIIDGVYQHNEAYMVESTSLDYAADKILPTYPTGTQQFLNGGDL